MADDSEEDLPEFQLPEPGFTLPPGDPAREAVEKALRDYADESLRLATDTVAGFNAQVQARQRSNRQVTDIQLGQLERSILDALGQQLTTSTNQYRDVFNAQVDIANIQLDTARDLTESLADHVQSETSRGIEATQDALDAITGQLTARIDGATDAVQGGLESLDADIGAAVSRILDGVDRSDRSATESVLRSIEAANGASEAQIGALRSQVQASLSETLGSVQASTDGILGTLGEVAGAAVRAGSLVGDAVNGVAGPIVDQLGRPIWEALLQTLGLATPGELQDSADAPLRVLEAMAPEAKPAVDSLRRALQSSGLPPFLQALAGVALTVLAAPITAKLILERSAERTLQGLAPGMPWQLLPVPDLIDAFKRGLKSLETVVAEIRSQGYTPQDATTAVALRRLIAPTGVLLEWWLRNIVPETRLDAELRGMGYDEADITSYKRAAFRIPGVADLISMAVREVFSPDQRSALGLDADYPSQLTEFARQQGLSEEWARNYWAAHWQLPSVTQAFEMLHRGVITNEQLSGYLRAADVSPVWRERLTAISYRPLSRVDLRRMWSLGLLDHSDLVQGYLDLGYNPEHAEQLAQFAEVERQSERARRESEYGLLTPAQLREAVKDGLLPRQDAARELEGRGYSSRAADIFLSLTSQGTPSQ